jgi:hypothetical protein
MRDAASPCDLGATLHELIDADPLIDARSRRRNARDALAAGPAFLLRKRVGAARALGYIGNESPPTFRLPPTHQRSIVADGDHTGGARARDRFVPPASIRQSRDFAHTPIPLAAREGVICVSPSATSNSRVRAVLARGHAIPRPGAWRRRACERCSSREVDRVERDVECLADLPLREIARQQAEHGEFPIARSSSYGIRLARLGTRRSLCSSLATSSGKTSGSVHASAVWRASRSMSFAARRSPRPPLRLDGGIALPPTGTINELFRCH